MEIAYYGELDPFTGVDQNVATLDVIVKELEWLLLLYDVVIVPPDNLFDHRLALPAFEMLAPFVRAGRLTTTAEHSVRRPVDLVENRAELYTEEWPGGRFRGELRRGTLARYRRGAIAEIRERWQRLLPAEWTLQRDVGAQIEAFADRLALDCATTPHEAASGLLKEAVDRARQSKIAATRTHVFTRLTAEHARALPRDLARAALVVQMAYFELGAATHRSIPGQPGPGYTCRLFPGRFARFLRDKGILAADKAWTYDWNASLEQMRTRWQSVGCASTPWAALSAEELLDVAGSPEWKALRPLLRGTDLPAEVERELSAKLAAASDIRDVLGRLDGALPAAQRCLPGAVAARVSVRPAPVLLASPWQLATQAVLATHLPAPSSGTGITLDLRTATMSLVPGGPCVSLGAAAAVLLTLLIIAGDQGLTARDVKQWNFDAEELDKKAERWFFAWTPQSQEPESDDGRRLGRLNMLKTRTNRNLAPLGVRIAVESGKSVWRLVHPSGDGYTIHLEGTLWDLLESQDQPAGPRDLPPQQAALWSALAREAPYCVGLESLAGRLGKPSGKLGLKQTLDTLRKLNDRLIADGAPARVCRVTRGHYALTPQSSGGASMLGADSQSFG